MKISENIEESRRAIDAIYQDCSDVKKQTLDLNGWACYLLYLEVTLAQTNLMDSALGSCMGRMREWSSLPREEQKARLDSNAMGISDLTYYDTIEDAARGLLVGDAILLLDGYPRALKIPDKGYPGMAVSESDSEKVVRGSNEAFTDSVKVNAALVRKRLRSVHLKNRSRMVGEQTQTLVNLLYMDTIAKPQLLDYVERRLDGWSIDGILDSGMIEQLAEDKWYSPFPQYQTTQRPDRAVMALLEGRAILLCDNSPLALIMPVDFNSFLRTSDDYYNRTGAATLARLLRYMACFFAMAMPGLYLAMTNFHTQIMPTTLLLSFQEARFGVPFPAALEVLLMEISFELLRKRAYACRGRWGARSGSWVD